MLTSVPAPGRSTIEEARKAAGHSPPRFSGAGYVEGFSSPGNSVTVMLQSAKARQARLKIRYLAASGDEQHKVLVNYTLLLDPVHGYTSWEKFIVFPKAEDWTEIDLDLDDLKEGDNSIKFYSGGRGTVAVDYFKLEPAN